MQERKIAVLGGGMVGGFIARRLAHDGFAVTLYDRDPAALEASRRRAPLDARQADRARAEVVAEAAGGADLVVGAVPGFLGHATARTVIEAGRPLVDISFFPEDPRDLDGPARARGVPAILDCGVMPGLGGMLGAYLARRLTRADALTIMVGGLPVARHWPLEYKAPFSPIDVIEEYTRPARFKDRGTIVTRPALSEPELVDFPGVGTLEAFNTDGLRTLLWTLEIPTMREKTLRWPGHVEKIRVLQALGFFGEEVVAIGSQRVRPLDLTARLLIDDWRLEPGEEEFTAMRVEVEGLEGSQRVVKRVDLLDRTDPSTGDSSMARTTGWPAIVAARLLAEGKLGTPGAHPSEVLAFDEPLFREFLAHLDEAGIALRFS